MCNRQKAERRGTALDKRETLRLPGAILREMPVATSLDRRRPSTLSFPRKRVKAERASRKTRPPLGEPRGGELWRII